jgi:hypothetical protein
MKGEERNMGEVRVRDQLQEKANDKGNVFPDIFDKAWANINYNNVKLSLCLINSGLCHDDLRENAGTAPPSLTSAQLKVNVQFHAPVTLPLRNNPH